MTGAPPVVREGDQRDGAAPGSRRGVTLLDIAPLLTLILVAAMASQSIRDNSFLWHIRAGSAQRAMGAVLTEDPFSFTRGGSPWRTQSWLVEILYSHLESMFASYAWVSWMIFIVGSATVVMIALSLKSVVGSPVSVTIALIPLIWLVAPFLQPRPVLFSFLLLASLVVVLQHKDAALWAVVPIIWIWAACHGSWVIGGLLIVLEWMRSGDRRVLKAGSVALVATLLTAHGFGTWVILRDFADARAALDNMQEWGTPDLTSIPHFPFFLLIVGVMVGMMRGRIVPRDLVVIVPFLLLGLSANRSIAPAAIVLAPWAAMAVPDVEIPSRGRPASMIAAFAAVAAGFVLLPMVVRPLGVFDLQRFPSPDLVAGLAGRTAFHDDAVGGYLIFADWPDTLVYIDDRAELYGVELSTEYVEAVEGSYEEAFDRWGFDAAITRDDWPLTRRLERDGWTLIDAEQELRLYYAP